MNELNAILIFLGFVYAIRKLTNPVLITKEIKK
jgi:hypothetical protein